MKAIVLREKGDADTLRLEDVPDPVPGPGEALVRVRAAALNHRDVFIRQGLYPGIRYPIITGSDGAGEVVAVGEGVDDSIVGWHVVIDPSLNWGPDMRAQGPDFTILGLPENGTFAEFVRVPAANVHAMPSGMSFEEAATLPLAGVTAFRAVVTRGQVKPDEVVVVTGAGGGVAAFAIQMARYAGARVFVTSGSDEKIARAIELGAEGGVNYRSPDWAKRLRELTDGGPDVVIDSTGGPNFDQVLDVARPGGRVVVYGATLGAVPNMQLRRIFWKQLTVIGSTMGTKDDFAEMLKWAEAGAIQPVIDRVFPLAEMAAAQRRMEEAGQFGKIVVVP